MPKYVDHAERRRELLDTAAAIITTEGINAATIRRIASASGFTTGMVTHYFASKDGLIIGTIARFTAAPLSACSRSARAARDCRHRERSSPRRSRSRLIARRNGGSGLLTGARRGPASHLSASSAEHYAAWRWLVTTLLAEAAGSGQTRHGLDVEATADCLIAVVDGLGIQAVYDPDRMTPSCLMAALDAELSQLTWPRDGC